MTHQLTLFDCASHCKQAEKMARKMLKEWQAEYQPPIKDIPASERPINRLVTYGSGALSTTELIAVLLGGSRQLYQAQELLNKFDSLMGLARGSHHELASTVQGVGVSSAARIKAAFELGRRLMIAAPDDRPQVKSPADAANLLMAEMSTLEQEHLRTILLDSKNHVLATPTIYVGNLNTSVVRVCELFREAIRLNCAALIVVHNHPSGDPTPSPEDVKVTELIVQAGTMMDIEVLDHLIIGHQRYVSLKERGLGFS
jgi:DNA repair protein RadC